MSLNRLHSYFLMPRIIQVKKKKKRKRKKKEDFVFIMVDKGSKGRGCHQRAHYQPSQE